MRRKFILLFAVILTSFNAFAQDYKWMDDIKVGAEIGFSIPSMRYSSPMYDEYKKSALFSGMGGVFVDWKFYDNFSLRPHLNFVGRGVKMKYEPQFIDYKLKATYFDVRIPVVYTFDLNSKIKPFLAAGPSLNFVAGGKVHYGEGSANRQIYDVKLAKGNFRPLDFGIYLGAGFDYPIQFNGFPLMVGAEIGYNIGLVDSFSKAEKNNHAVAVNTPVYNVLGTRKNGNLSISVNISIPLKNLFGKKKDRRSKPAAAPIVQVKETVPERKVTVQAKQCCSLDEMYELILNGQDISLKKICAFDDIKFDFDKSTIRQESIPYLDKFVAILTKFPTLRLSIIGHTDSIGEDYYNLLLSKRRAESVANYFISNGVSADRLRCYGYGSRQPLTNNSNAQERAINRRVEFDIIEGTF